jgi:hypothetical protein
MRQALREALDGGLGCVVGSVTPMATNLAQEISYPVLISMLTGGS